MTQIQLDEIFVDELYVLQKEIDSYINSQNAAERAFCEGYAEYEEIQEDCQYKAQRMKQRIRGLAVSMGIRSILVQPWGDGKAVVVDTWGQVVPWWEALAP